MPTVDTPIAWYYPLEYNLGTWKYEYGDKLLCQIWDCDGGPGGCDPGRPTALPSIAAGDDLLGQASMDLGEFELLGAAYLNMTVPPGGKGEVGTNSGSVLISCPGCRQLLRDNPSWVNPYSAPTQQTPPSSTLNSTTGGNTTAATPPPAVSSPPPAVSPSPSPSPAPETNLSPPTSEPVLPPLQSFEGPPAAEEEPPPPAAAPAPIEPLPTPSPSPSPAAVVPPILPEPVPSSPPEDPLASQPDEIKQDEELLVPEPVEITKKSSKTTLVIVLSVVGAVLAVLLISILGCILFKRGWKTIKPEQHDGAPPAKPTARKTSNRYLKIRVQRPAEADAAMRQHRVAGAIAELPWAPKSRT